MIEHDGQMTSTNSTIDFQPLNDVRADLGESPVFDRRRNVLWFADITRCVLHRTDLATGTHTQRLFPSEVGSLGLAASGRLVVALRHTVGLFDPNTDSFRAIAAIEAEQGASTRLNDGKVGPDGAFWVGSMDDRDRPDKQPIGALYRVTADGAVEKKVEGLVISNGLAFSPDGRSMFHSDSRARWLDRWDLEPATGAISNRTRIAAPDDAMGRPDGGATDAEGYYWSAGISAQRLNRYAPDGRLVETHAVPVGAPTMPCFGGADMKTLFVTSLRSGRPAELLARFPLTGITVVGTAQVAGADVGVFADR